MSFIRGKPFSGRDRPFGFKGGFVGRPRGFSPLDLGSSLLAWWSSDRPDLMSMTGNQVSAWADIKSGYTPSQGVSASRPVYDVAGFGGAPGVYFDGVDDYLEMTNPAAFPIGSNPVEIWCIAQQDFTLAQSTLDKGLFAYGGSTANETRSLRRRGSGGQNRASFVVGTGSASPQTVADGLEFVTRHLVTGRIEPAQVAVVIDTQVEGTSALVPATTNTGFLRIGSLSNTAPSNYWKGPVRDVIVTLPLTANQRSAMREWALPRRMI